MLVVQHAYSADSNSNQQLGASSRGVTSPDLPLSALNYLFTYVFLNALRAAQRTLQEHSGGGYSYCNIHYMCMKEKEMLSNMSS